MKNKEEGSPQKGKTTATARIFKTPIYEGEQSRIPNAGVEPKPSEGEKYAEESSHRLQRGPRKSAQDKKKKGDEGAEILETLSPRGETISPREANARVLNVGTRR